MIGQLQKHKQTRTINKTGTTHKRSVFSEEGLKLGCQALLSKVDYVLISNFNPELPFQHRFTLFISDKMIQFIEYQSFEVSFAWAKQWHDHHVYMNNERLGQEALIPFFKKLEETVSQALGKDTLVFKPIESFKKPPKKNEEFQQIIAEDIERFPIHVNLDFCKTSDFSTVQSVAFAIGKLRSILADRPRTAGDLTTYLNTDHVSFFSEPRIMFDKDKRSLENMDIRLFSGIKKVADANNEESASVQTIPSHSQIDKTLKKELIEQSQVSISTDMTADEKRDIIYTYYKKIAAKDFKDNKHVSLYELLNLIKASYLSWPRVDDSIHKLLRNAIKIYVSELNFSVVVEECDKAGWLTPQSIHSFFADFEYLASVGFRLAKAYESSSGAGPRDVESYPLTDHDEQFLNRWGSMLLRQENTDHTFQSKGKRATNRLALLDAAYQSEIVDDEHKFKAWKRQFIQASSGLIDKSLAVSKILLTINQRPDDADNNPRFKAIKMMVYIMDKKNLMKFSANLFDNYMKAINRELSHVGIEMMKLPSDVGHQKNVKFLATNFAHVFNKLISHT